MTQNEAPERLYMSVLESGYSRFRPHSVLHTNEQSGDITYIRSDIAEARANAKAAAVLVEARAGILDRLTVYGTDSARQIVRDVFDEIQLKENQ